MTPDGLRYNSYSSYFKRTYGSRLQKLSLDAGFGCPNRDPDDRTRGGCTFCNNRAFNPNYCSPSKTIARQLDEGIEFHQHRYRKADRYLAYFQPYSNTFAPLETLKRLYSEALAHPLVAGLIIGTRPDCVDEEKLDYIASLSKTCYIAVEYGIESCYDDTLRAINRGHLFEATRRAIQLTADRGIHCGAHIILGFPNETDQMLLEEADIINTLPINTLKMHQLQILVGTPMAEQYKTTPPPNRTLQQYVSLVCDIVERLRHDIMIERFAGEVPPRYQAFPELSWHRPDGRLIRNEEIPVLVNKELTQRNTYQGIKYKKS